MQSKKGFTIIEILVVIIIIGVLASIVVFSVINYIIKSRDATRKSDLRQLETALSVYFSENGSYPITDEWCSSEPDDLVSGCGGAGGEYIPGLAPGYIGSLPRDPKGGNSTNPICDGSGWKRAILYKSDGTDYKLLFHCAPEGDILQGDPFFDCVRPQHAWMICSDNPDVCGILDLNDPPVCGSDNCCYNGVGW